MLVPFCTMQHITNAKYVLEDITLEAKRLTRSRKKIIHCLHGKSTTLLRKIGSLRILSSQALHNDALREVLLVIYKINYEFHGYIIIK